MIDYLVHFYDKMFDAWLQHLYLLVITLVISVFISFILSFLIFRIPKLSQIVMAILKVLYTIPSLAFFALLIPLSGVGTTTAIIALIAYALFFLVSSFLEGLHGIDPLVLEAGEAMGYSPLNLFLKVQLPLCLPSILGGIRTASISTIGISCIAYAIGAGGIGTILFEGMRQLSYVKIMWGAILVITLNVLVNTIFLKLERYLSKKYHLND